MPKIAPPEQVAHVDIGLSTASVSLSHPVRPQCHQSPPLCQHMPSGQASDFKGYWQVAVSAYLAADSRLGSPRLRRAAFATSHGGVGP
jgi:hypothetical protein